MPRDSYQSPFSTRYASKEMQHLFSEEHKFRTWRRLWVALAEAEQAEGLAITDEQIAELKAHVNDINYEDAMRREAQCRHDVMSHVYAYGLQCPHAKGIIHLGATSCYVGDNTDLLIMRDALALLHRKLLSVMELLANFAEQHASLPALAYTHYQPAQLTTVGKRASLWLYELYLDQQELEHRLATLPFLGCKGTTGTQASFLELFDGDETKAQAVDTRIAQAFGFAGTVPVSGQTYSRKWDAMVSNVLCGIAQSCMKFAMDLRLLQNFKEMEEPFEAGQIGSSAMPYKRNPMRCERICALARYVMTDSLNPVLTAGAQGFERTLDDSANKRISIAEAFLATDGILDIMLNVCDGLVVYPRVIHARVMAELPFMATENILMDAVKRGGDRQQLHEKLRVYSQRAARVVKEEGLENPLAEYICADPDFGVSREELNGLLDPKRFTGRAAQQTLAFVNDTIRPLLQAHSTLLGARAVLNV